MEKTTRRLRKAQATIGLDLGDKRHTFCVLDTRGEVVNKGSMRNERTSLQSWQAHTREPWWSWRQECIRLGLVDFLTLSEWRSWWPTLARPAPSRKASARVMSGTPLFWPVWVGRTATCLVRSYTVVKKPNMTYSRSNCATAWCGRGWHWSIQCALP